MPLRKCKTDSGASGWKWGEQGKCYKNKRDAVRQGLAIEGPKGFQAKATPEEYGGLSHLERLSLKLNEILGESQNGSGNC